MSDPVATLAAGAAASPCTQVCTLDTHDICLGCGRTLDEIAAWAAMTDDAKRTVIEAATTRLARPAAATLQSR